VLYLVSYSAPVRARCWVERPLGRNLPRRRPLALMEGKTKTRKDASGGEQRGDPPIKDLDGKLRKFAERNAITVMSARALFAQFGLVRRATRRTSTARV
jgi:hypothetical protein